MARDNAMDTDALQLIDLLDAAGLSEGEAEVYVAREVVELDRQTAADELDKAASTVDSLLSRARHKLKNMDAALAQLEDRDAMVGQDDAPPGGNPEMDDAQRQMEQQAGGAQAAKRESYQQNLYHMPEDKHPRHATDDAVNPVGSILEAGAPGVGVVDPENPRHQFQLHCTIERDAWAVKVLDRTNAEYQNGTLEEFEQHLEHYEALLAEYEPGSTDVEGLPTRHSLAPSAVERARKLLDALRDGPDARVTVDIYQ